MTGPFDLPTPPRPYLPSPPAESPFRYRAQIPYEGPPAGIQPHRNGKATAALVLGLCSILLFTTLVVPLLALIFGLIAASEIRRSAPRETGLAMARWGWILGLLGIFAFGGVWVVVAILDIENDKPADHDAAIGSCFNLPEIDLEEIIDAVGFDPVACDDPHDGELFHKGELNPDRDRTYPGEDAVAEEVAVTCVGGPFTDYVGIVYDLSIYDVYVVFTRELTWKAAYGGYECYIYDPSGAPIVGSVRNTVQ